MSEDKLMESKGDTILNTILSVYSKKFKSELVLTEEEKIDIIEYASKIRYGSTAWIPMVCLGKEDCVYKNSCVTGDTIVTTLTGEKMIKDTQEGEYVLSCNVKNHKISYEKILAKTENGEKEVYKIKSFYGQELKCTKDHEIYTITDVMTRVKNRLSRYVKYERPIETLKHKWLSIDNGLSKSNKIAILDENKCFGEKELSDGLAEFFGYYLTDGTSSGGQISFTNTNKAMISDFIRICKQLGTNCRISERKRENRKIAWDVRPTNGHKKINPIKEILKKYNLYMKKGKDKFIPDIFFDCKKEYICKLLNRAWSGDGCICVYNNCNKKAVVITYVCECYIQIKQIQILLRKIGIYTNIRKKKDGLYTIHTSSVRNIKKFFNNVGIIYGKEVKCYEALEILKTIDDRFSVTENDIRWDRVSLIEKVGIEKVYDIEVENNHNFFANNILIHNCPIIEKAPLGAKCPFEEYAAVEWFNDYVQSLDIDVSDKIERSQIMELVESDIINARANAVLGSEGFIMDNPIGIDQDTGNTIYRKEEHLAMSIKGRVQTRRDRILKAFVATRESKVKAMKGSKEDPTEYMARLRATALRTQEIHDVTVVVDKDNTIKEPVVKEDTKKVGEIF